MQDASPLLRQLERERKARKNAEGLLESKSLELYDANRALACLNASLEKRVQERTGELQQANDGLHLEIELRREAERHLRIYSEVIRSTGEAVAITDLAGNIIEVNPAYESAIGRSREELLGTSLYGTDPDHDFEKLHRQLWRALETEGRWTGEVLERRSNGESFPSWATVNAVRDERGCPVHYVCVSRDITALKEGERQLKELAFYDPLTHLPNRALFNDRLGVALASARRLRALVAVIYLDIDRFKNINDSFGHPFGDALLNAVAARLKADVRDSDTVARLGGDEFVIMVPGLARIEDAGNVAQKILTTFSRPLMVEGRELYLTASIGVSVFPEDGDSADALLKNADAAMYRVKEHGRDGFRCYTQEMGVQVQEQVEIENALHRALEQQQFELHYQPIIDLKSGQVRGVEALLRWRHPQLGPVLPNRFIPLAEESGLIVPIGEWVLRTACAQAKAWQAAAYPDLSVTVNLSARQFRQQSVPELVRRVLAHTGLAPEDLELELTESLLMRDSENVVQALRELKAVGVGLSLDDFGTGYSSLSYLKRFPIDILKIDRSFIRDVTASVDDASLTRAIIAMAHSLNMTTVAEGVETEGQLRFLRANRCDAIQGYYFSRPLPASEVSALLRAGKHLPPDDFGGGTADPAVLLVDDNEHDLALLYRALRHEGYRILTTGSARQALELLALHRVAVVVSDHRMPDMSGVHFLSRVKELYPDTGRIMLSAHADLHSVTAAINEGGVQKFHNKPWDDRLLRAHIADGFRRHEGQAIHT